MPIVAIAAAIFAAAEIVEVGLAAMTVFEAVAAVGAVTNGVGVVTGNKDLQAVGQVMAIGGGLGMAATKLNVLEWNPTVSEVTGIPTRAQAAAAPATAASTTTNTMTGAAIAPSDAVGTINAADTTVAAAPAAPAVAAAPVASVAAPGSAVSLNLESGLMPPAAVAPTNGMFAASTPVAPVTWFSAAKDYIAPFTEFAKENQMLTYGALQAGGSVVAGLFDPLKPAQTKKAEAEADLLASQKTLQDQQMANMAAPMPVAYRKPKVLPVQSSNKPVGLINASTA